MPVRIINTKLLEGKWAVYHRPTKKLLFLEKDRDDPENLSLGQVTNGEVGGRRIEEFIIKKRKGKKPC